MGRPRAGVVSGGLDARGHCIGRHGFFLHGGCTTNQPNDRRRLGHVGGVDDRRPSFDATAAQRSAGPLAALLVGLTSVHDEVQPSLVW